MSRANNLSHADPTTLVARKELARTMLSEGKTYTEVIAAVREKYGVGIGFGTLNVLRRQLVKEKAKEVRRAARAARANLPAVAPAPWGDLASTVKELCVAGLCCTLRRDGGIEVTAR